MNRWALSEIPNVVRDEGSSQPSGRPAVRPLPAPRSGLAGPAPLDSPPASSHPAGSRCLALGPAGLGPAPSRLQRASRSAGGPLSSQRMTFSRPTGGRESQQGVVLRNVLLAWPPELFHRLMSARLPGATPSVGGDAASWRNPVAPGTVLAGTMAAGRKGGGGGGNAGGSYSACAPWTSVAQDKTVPINGPPGDEPRWRLAALSSDQSSRAALSPR